MEVRFPLGKVCLTGISLLQDTDKTVESPPCITLCDELSRSVKRSQRLCDLMAAVQHVLSD